jgi:type I restriction enzyme S subunit
MMEWKEYKLGDLCDVSIGRTPPRNEFKWFNQDSHSYKWVSIKDMGKSTKYLYNTSETITVEGQKEFNIPIVPNNTVILSFKLTLGRVAITGNEDMLTNEAIAQLPIKNERVLNIEYLYYYLKNFNYDTLGNTSSIATAVNSKTIKNLPVVVPPYEKQLVIVSILSEIDKKIECNNKTCANLEAQAQALFKHWFVDFAPFKDGKFVESELGLIPEGWRVGRLEELCSFISRGLSPNYKLGTNELVLGQTCVRNNFVTLDNAREHLPKDNCNKFVKKWDVLLNSTGIGSLGRVGIIYFNNNNVCFDSHLTVVRTAEEIYRYYVGRNLLNRQKELENMAVGSTGQTELPKKDVLVMPILIPNSDISPEFNDIIENIGNKIYTLIEENQRLSTLRDTLLPKLMSGQIKV